MRYDELVLTIRSDGQGGFRVGAESNRFKGCQEEPFMPPWSREELAATAKAVEAQTRREAGDDAGRQRGGDERSSPAAEAAAPHPPPPSKPAASSTTPSSTARSPSFSAAASPPPPRTTRSACACAWSSTPARSRSGSAG